MAGNLSKASKPTLEGLSKIGVFDSLEEVCVTVMKDDNVQIKTALELGRGELSYTLTTPALQLVPNNCLSNFFGNRPATPEVT